VGGVPRVVLCADQVKALFCFVFLVRFLSVSFDPFIPLLFNHDPFSYHKSRFLSVKSP